MNIKVVFCVFFVYSICCASRDSDGRIGSPQAGPLKTLEQEVALRDERSKIERAVDRNGQMTIRNQFAD